MFSEKSLISVGAPEGMPVRELSSREILSGITNYHLPVSGFPLRSGDQIISAEFAEAGNSRSEQIGRGTASSGDLFWSMQRTADDESGRLCIMVWRKENGQWRLCMSRGLFSRGSFENYQYLRCGDLRSPGFRLEEEFCRDAADLGIRASFYKYMDDAGFGTGAGDSLRSRDDYLPSDEADAGDRPYYPKLFWKAECSLVSKDASLSANAGPYRYLYLDDGGTEMKSYGFFFTVWQRKADGSYRFLIDAGNTSPEISDGLFR